MKTSVSTALASVANVNQIAGRLARVPVSDATKNCAVQGDNNEFLTAVNAAETDLRAAFDDVMGAQLTALDNALDQVRRARRAYYQNVASNRKDAAAFTAAAQRFADEVQSQS